VTNELIILHWADGLKM